MSFESVSSSPIKQFEKETNPPHPDVEHLPIREAVQDVAIVEEIAEARIFVEQMILKDQLPRPQWMRYFIREILPKFPNLSPYKNFFFESLEQASHAQYEVKRALYEIRKDIASDRKTSITDVTSNEVSERIFLSLVGEIPRGRIEAKADGVALEFIIHDQQDLAAITQRSEDKVANLLGSVFVWKGTGLGANFSIIVINESKSLDVEDTRIHESEHAKNSILSAAQAKALDFCYRPDSEIKKRLERWKNDSFSAEEWAKDEVLAYATELEIYDYTEEGLREFFDELTIKLSGTSSYYEKKYFTERVGELNREVPIERQVEVYRKRVKSSTKALEKAFHLFNRDARKVISILEQFPLHHWAAVVRLLEMNHRKKEQVKMAT